MSYMFSHMGSWHRQNGGENQDALCMDGSADFAVIALADGVSSCREAKRGAEIACHTLTELMLCQGQRLLSFPIQDVIGFALNRIRNELQKQGGRMEDYASTVSAVLLDRKNRRLLCLNLGDCLIGGTEAGKCRILAAPSDSSSGCYVTTTRNAEQVTAVCSLPVGQLDSVFLCSDGLWQYLMTGEKFTDESSELLTNHAYRELERQMEAEDGLDDASFIVLELEE